MYISDYLLVLVEVLQVEPLEILIDIGYFRHLIRNRFPNAFVFNWPNIF